jgi:hypothetical protein
MITIKIVFQGGMVEIVLRLVSSQLTRLETPNVPRLAKRDA